MSGPEDAYYWVQLAADPKPFVGVDLGSAPERLVTTWDKDNVWAVKKLDDGNYSIVLEKSGRTVFIQVDAGYLVGTDKPTPVSWTLQRQSDGSYSIEVAGDGIPVPRGWTVRNPDPGLPVTLGIIENPLSTQRWNFYRRYGPE